MARFFSKVPNEVSFPFVGQVLTINAVLPFSWKLFYLAAVCFVISNLVYHLFCPKIIKDHRGYSSFQKEGMGIIQLKNYNNDCGRPAVIDEQTIYLSADQNRLSKEFWIVHEYADTNLFIARIIATAFLFAGTLMMTFVAAQGFWLVMANTF
jgi:hypothetical protein